MNSKGPDGGGGGDPQASGATTAWRAIRPHPSALSCWCGEEPCFELTVILGDHLDPWDPRSLDNKELMYFE